MITVQQQQLDIQLLLLQKITSNNNNDRYLASSLYDNDRYLDTGIMIDIPSADAQYIRVMEE